MRRLIALLLCVVPAVVFSVAIPSASLSPALAPSAAQPAVAGSDESRYARQAAETIRMALRKVAPDEALQRIPQEGIQTPDVEASCRAAPGATAILVCHYGPQSDIPVGQLLLWYDYWDGWKVQLYPNAPPALALERQEFFAETGCRLGCRGAVKEARQLAGNMGPELLVVVDLAGGQGAPAEEVHLLRLVGDDWRILWVPGSGDWNYGHAEVLLSSQSPVVTVRSSSWLRQDALAGYLDEREEAPHRYFRERWVRKGDSFILRDRVEEPSPYAALVRLIHYLTVGAEEKAHSLMNRRIPIDTAVRTLAQKPARGGWRVTPWGETGFLLDTQKTGTPDVGVRFAQKGTEWVLSELYVGAELCRVHSPCSK